MEIAIAGAGAMGAMFGGYLALAGHDVVLVDVAADHLAAIDRDGLVLELPDGSTRTARPRTTTDPVADLPGPLDAVIVLCKGWANAAVGASIRHTIGPSTWVATVQNGLGNDVALVEAIGSPRVLPGTTTAGAERHRPGHVVVSPITASGRSVTHLGPPRNTDARDGIEPLTAALTDAGLPCELLPDADQVIWTKLAMAGTAGPLTAALGTTVRGMVESPAAMTLFDAMFDEIVAVAAAEGVVLDRDAVRAHAMATYAAVGAHLTSMAADVVGGRRSEIDSFCVEVARRGARHGVATPVNDTIGRLIVAREEEAGLR